MRVGAVAEFAMLCVYEDFLEVAAYLVRCHIESAEAFDAGGIDNVASCGKFYHFTEGGGVGTCVVSIGYFGGAKVLFGQQSIDERAFPYSTVAAEQGYFACKDGKEGIGSFA